MYIFTQSPYCYYYVDIESGFRVSIWVSGIRGFGFGEGLSPESVFARSEPAPLPSLGEHRSVKIKTKNTAVSAALRRRFGHDTARCAARQPHPARGSRRGPAALLRLA
jgi:hypothetical protein